MLETAGVWVGLQILNEWKGVVRDCAGMWAGLQILQEWKSVVRDRAGVWMGLESVLKLRVWLQFLCLGMYNVSVGAGGCG